MLAERMYHFGQTNFLLFMWSLYLYFVYSLGELTNSTKFLMTSRSSKREQQTIMIIIDRNGLFKFI